MCVSSMANDGGLREVFASADLVYNQLMGMEASASSSAAGVKRKPSRSLSEAESSSLSAMKAHSNTTKMNLSQHSSAVLRRTIAPLIHSMQQIDAAALLSLNPNQDGNGAILDQNKGLSVPPIHDRITPYHRNSHDNTVRYLHCKEIHDHFSMGIFVFPPGASIPLHDHPSMVVISRVLYGELHVKSYSVVSTIIEEEDHIMDIDDDVLHNEAQHSETSPSRLRTSINRIKDFVSRAVYSSHHDDKIATQPKLQVEENPSILGVQISKDKDGERSAIISAPNVTALYPDEGNCHSFVAGPNGAAVLDVLLPPYAEDEDRDCTFYEAVKNENGYCLTPIDQPSDFNCLSGEYGRFTSCEQY